MVEFEACVFQFLSIYIVCVTKDIKTILCQFTDTSHAKAGAGERLTRYVFLRKTKKDTEFSHFVFEQGAERLNKSYKLGFFGESAHVVVALDDCATGVSAFNDIGIDCALCKETAFIFCTFFFKHTDKFLTDYNAFLFGVGDAFQPVKESLFCIDVDKLQVLASECCLNLFWFVFSHHTVINEDASHLVGDCTLQNCCGD